MGLSLDEIKLELGRLPASRTPTRAGWARISHDWRTRLDEQIQALAAPRDGLAGCIGCGCLSLKQCRISNPADVAVNRSTAGGAVFLPPLLRKVADRV